MLTTPPKVASRRTIDLPDPAVNVLREHLEATGPALPSDPLFTRPDASGLRPQHIELPWVRARAQVGVQWAHFHDLRHAGLTLAAQAGASTRELMAAAGTPRSGRR